MKPSSSVCALVSGGLDSMVLLDELAKSTRKVYPVFFRQGLLWEKGELRALRHFLGGFNTLTPQRFNALTVLNLPVHDFYGNHWSVTGQRVPGAKTRDESVYLPGRNLMLLSKAAVFCALRRIPVIAIGTLGHNPFADATPEFFRDFARVAGKALRFKLQIIAPFRNLTKEQVIRRGRHLPLHLSFSCIVPKRGRHCGRCNKCAERQRAFRAAGVADRTRYGWEENEPQLRRLTSV
jgi:7-cyano-7-deazaguanine synthase